MMYLCSCDRRRFVDFVVSRERLCPQDVDSAQTLEGLSPKGEDLLLVWKEPPSQSFTLPNAVVVDEARVLDFLAWVSTYFQHIRPFTAHCRVLPYSQAQTFCQSSIQFSLPDMGSADIGLILSEGVAYSVGRADLGRLPYPAFARTLSFSYAEALKRRTQILNPQDRLLDQIAAGWMKTRGLSNQPLLDLSPASIGEVWSILIDSVRTGVACFSKKEERPLVEALQNIRELGRISFETWTRLHDELIDPKSIEAMDGPREGRVKAVESSIGQLVNGSQQTQRRRSFILGYMVSRISPGSLDHFPLLFPAISGLRESFLWYGVCAGLNPNTSVDNFGNGLAWLMKRELRRSADWLDRPACDIALQEMTILFQDRNGGRTSLLTTANGSLKVEILPLVNVSVKWPDPIEETVRPKATTSGQQGTFFGEDQASKQDLVEILKAIRESSSTLSSIRRRVEIALDSESSKKRGRQK